jgi:hypothetical protein
LQSAAPLMLHTLKAMPETPYEKPIGAWFYAIHKGINKAKRKP